MANGGRGGGGGKKEACLEDVSGIATGRMAQGSAAQYHRGAIHAVEPREAEREFLERREVEEEDEEKRRGRGRDRGGTKHARAAEQHEN